jgi:hypothetical protein
MLELTPEQQARLAAEDARRREALDRILPPKPGPPRRAREIGRAVSRLEGKGASALRVALVDELVATENARTVVEACALVEISPSTYGRHKRRVGEAAGERPTHFRLTAEVRPKDAERVSLTVFLARGNLLSNREISTRVSAYFGRRVYESTVRKDLAGAGQDAEARIACFWEAWTGAMALQLRRATDDGEPLPGSGRFGLMVIGDCRVMKRVAELIEKAPGILDVELPGAPPGDSLDEWLGYCFRRAEEMESVFRATRAPRPFDDQDPTYWQMLRAFRGWPIPATTEERERLGAWVDRDGLPSRRVARLFPPAS